MSDKRPRVFWPVLCAVVIGIILAEAALEGLRRAMVALDLRQPTFMEALRGDVRDWQERQAVDPTRKP